MNLINKLTTYASLIGVIGAIGGGFYAWGEFNTRLIAIENKDFVVNETVDLTPTSDRISALEVDLIDRITALKEQVESGQEVDLTEISATIVNLKKELSQKIEDAEAGINADLKAMKETLTKVDKEVAIALKENKLQDEKIEAVRLKATNPLATN